MARKDIKRDEAPSEFDENVVSINRCSKVVKGGRNFSFGALVIIGDRKGRVGYGYGKANEVADAIRKGSEIAKKALINVPLHGNTLPHIIKSKYSGAEILLKPASSGTGLIAGGTVRAILELAGVKDILAKSLGANNSLNVAKATFKAIENLSTKKTVLAKRGIQSL